MNDLDTGAGCNLSKFTGETDQEGIAKTPKSYTGLQRDLEKLEKWTDRNLRKFSKGRCTGGRHNPRHQCMLQATQMEISFAKKNLVILVVSELSMNQEGAVATQTANSDLGCSQEQLCQHAEGGGPCPLFSIDEATPGGLTSSGLPGRRHLDTLETAPQRVTQVVKGWKHLSYDKKLKEQELFNLERRLRGISSTFPQKPKGRVQTGQNQALSRGTQ